MKSVLFLNSHLLYAKSTLPVALYLCEAGYDVFFLTNELIGLDKRDLAGTTAISPTESKTVNTLTLAQVAKLIGLDKEYEKQKENFNFINKAGLLIRRFDHVVGTTKDIDRVAFLCRKKMSGLVLGYQHLPVVGRTSRKATAVETAIKDSVFFSENKFANLHKFSSIVRMMSDRRLVNFMHMDEVWRRWHADAGVGRVDGNHVIVYHPGGWRGIITVKGAPRDEALANQKQWMRKVCEPIFSLGLRPIIKIHPLCARDHDFEDVTLIAREIESDLAVPEGAIEILDRTEWVWQLATTAKALVVFGSSSIYELWSAGIQNIISVRYSNDDRSVKFLDLEVAHISVFPDALKEMTDSARDMKEDRGRLVDRVANAYAQLFVGDSVTRATKMLEIG